MKKLSSLSYPFLSTSKHENKNESNQGSTGFPKFQEPLQNSRHQIENIKTVPC